jgi:hypothetical protein
LRLIAYEAQRLYPEEASHAGRLLGFRSPKQTVRNSHPAPHKACIRLRRPELSDFNAFAGGSMAFTGGRFDLAIVNARPRRPMVVLTESQVSRSPYHGIALLTS